MYHLIFIIPYFLILLFQFIKHKGFTPLSILLILVIFSNISCLIVFPEFQIETVEEIQITLYTFIILSGILLPFYLFNGIKTVKAIPLNKLNRLTRFVYFFGSIGFFLTLLTALISIFLFRSISVNISEYKNGEVGEELLKNILPESLFTIMGFTMAFSFIALALHFYFLTQNQLKKSIFPFIISLTIPLTSLQEFSRGGLVMFVGLYIMTYLLLRNAIPKKVLKQFKNKLRIISISILSAFLFITLNRFQENSYNDNEMNPALESILVYAGQWNKNSLQVLKNYDDSKNLSGSRFKYLTRRVDRFLGNKVIDQGEIDKNTFGNLASAFRGLVSNLVYDLGYLGTLVFVIFYMLLYRIAKPNKNHEIRFQQIIYFILFSFISIFFFRGNLFVLSYFSFAVLITIFLNIFLKLKWR